MCPDTPRCYLTLRCDLSCQYCSNGPQVAQYDEMSVDGWLCLWRGTLTDEVILTGGEPTLHRHFQEIIARTPKLLTIYSNFARDVDVPSGLRIQWRASCHSQTKERAVQWVERVKAMRAKGYRMTLTTVQCPDEVLGVLRPHGIHVDALQVSPEPVSGLVRCFLPRYLIAPDGLRYHCVSKLVRRDPSGIVGLNAKHTIHCHDATRCVACDSIASERTAVE